MFNKITVALIVVILCVLIVVWKNNTKTVVYGVVDNNGGVNGGVNGSNITIDNTSDIAADVGELTHDEYVSDINYMNNTTDNSPQTNDIMENMNASINTVRGASGMSHGQQMRATNPHPTSRRGVPTGIDLTVFREGASQDHIDIAPQTHRKPMRSATNLTKTTKKLVSECGSDSSRLEDIFMQRNTAFE